MKNKTKRIKDTLEDPLKRIKHFESRTIVKTIVHKGEVKGGNHVELYNS